MVFDRKESLKQAIKDRSMDKNNLCLLIDMYVVNNKLTIDDQTELMELIYPPIVENVEEIENTEDIKTKTTIA